MTPTPSANRSEQRPGYVIITSVLILSAVMLMLGLASSAHFFGEVAAAQSTADKLQSRALADACVETALLKLRLNNSYAGNETIAVDNLNCLILGIISNGSARTVQTEGNFGDERSRVKVEISDVTVLQAASWFEMP